VVRLSSSVSAPGGSRLADTRADQNMELRFKKASSDQQIKTAWLP
jgi:hypothetical protein